MYDFATSKTFFKSKQTNKQKDKYIKFIFYFHGTNKILFIFLKPFLEQLKILYNMSFIKVNLKYLHRFNTISDRGNQINFQICFAFICQDQVHQLSFSALNKHFFFYKSLFFKRTRNCRYTCCFQTRLISFPLML